MRCDSSFAIDDETKQEANMTRHNRHLLADIQFFVSTITTAAPNVIAPRLADIAQFRTDFSPWIARIRPPHVPKRSGD
jgi:hypothetical protein